jgi:predicted Rossmann fold nucleotide-binding protein DprA/Smf involved in DNA uptake
MAQLVSTAEHLFDSMNWRPADALPEKLYISEREFNDKELSILAAIGDDGTPLDVIIERCGYNAGDVVATLLELELSDVVCQLPGKIYEKR